MQRPDDLPNFEELEKERQAQSLARRQFEQDKRGYVSARKSQEYRKTGLQGGGAKERARRAKRLGQLEVDLRGVPGPEEGSDVGAAGPGLLRLEPGATGGETP